MYDHVSEHSAIAQKNTKGPCQKDGKNGEGGMKKSSVASRRKSSAEITHHHDDMIDVGAEVTINMLKSEHENERRTYQSARPRQR